MRQYRFPRTASIDDLTLAEIETPAPGRGQALVRLRAASLNYRDRMMLELHERWPEYDFAGHKGYITDVHAAALDRHGPCPQHRMRFVNVARARDVHAGRALQLTGAAGMVDDEPMSPLAGDLR